MEELQPPKLGIQVQILSGRLHTHRVVTTKSILNGLSYTSDQVPIDETDVIQHQLINVNNEIVGYVDLVRTIRNNWETHMFIDVDERGKGLGVLLLSTALKKGLLKNINVMSSAFTSDDATRLWESKRINDAFLIEKIDSLDQVNGRIFTNEKGEIIRKRSYQYFLRSKRY